MTFEQQQTTYTVFKRKQEYFKIHKDLAKNLDKMKNQQNNDWDFKIIVSGNGKTRTGKSTLAAQMANYMDPNFLDGWKDRICFSGREVMKSAKKLPKGSWIIYDEARGGLNNKKQMFGFVQELMDFLNECGNLNQGIIFVLPDFFDLPKSVCVNQTIFSLNCYTVGAFKRGYFNFYSGNDKRLLYFKGNKQANHGAHPPTFGGTFPKGFPVDKEIYEQYKKSTLKAIRQEQKKEGSEIKKLRDRIALLLFKLKRDYDIDYKDSGKMVGVHRNTVTKWLNRESVKIESQMHNFGSKFINSDKEEV